jgi:formamidopyrimidine-DNA glycosylase
MTGRLVVDGAAAIEELRYGPRGGGDPRRWVRVAIRTAGGAGLEVVDPRRLGSLRLAPDLDALGPDAASVTVAELGPRLQSDRPLKALLLDQHVVAGLGNLLVDESLWRAHLRPGRTGRSLDPDDLQALVDSVVSTVDLLGRRGGSHTGDLQDPRDEHGSCPRCGCPLRRERIAGRTTVWCPDEQR